MSDASDTEDEVYQKGRDGIIFLVDATEPMFTENTAGDCAFRQCLKACDRAMMHKIKFSDLDLVGVVLFGTNITSNDANLSHISVLQGLQRPCSASVRELREMHESSTLGDFRTKFGHNEDYLMADLLWLTQSIFSKNTTKVASSRIILLSCSECFGKDDSHSRQRAKARATDLHGLSISLDFVPCAPEYKPSDFIATIMQIAGGLNEPWTVPKLHAISFLEDIPNIIETIVGSKDQDSKCYANLKFCIGGNISVDVEIYHLIGADGGPKKGKLHLSTNEKVTTKVFHLAMKVNFEEEGEDLSQPSTSWNAVAPEDQQRTINKIDLDKCQTFGEERVKFSQKEYEIMKHITDPGLVLLGFVPISFLKITHHCDTASFAYPSKSNSSGSRDLFTALWHRMGKKGVAAICSFLLRNGSYPRLVALVPSGMEKDNEILNEYRKHGIHVIPDPQGFHIFSFPFLDTINSLCLPKRPSASSEQMAKAVAVLKKLRFVFHPSRMPNPDIETKWAAVEAIALESPSVRPVVDEIQPDYAVIGERLGVLAEAFMRSVYGDFYDPVARETKKSSGGKTSKVPFNELDLDIVETAIKNHKVASLNMDKLKGYLRAKGMPVSGKRKQALIDDVYALRFQ